MGLRIFVICLCLMGGAVAWTDEPQTSNEPTLKELLAKIEKLEQRIKDLEAAQLPQAIYQYHAPQAPVIQAPGLPPAIQQYVPVDPGNPPRLLDPQRIQTAPRPVPEKVPSSWSRHEFNGSYYYTIPLGSSKPHAKVL